MFFAGVSERDITPPLGTPIPGLFHERFAEVIHDPLYVRAFAFEQEGEGVVIAVCDLIGIKREFLDQVKARVERAVGLTAARVLICCTHTHTGAEPSAKGYTDFLIGRIGDAICAAWVNRTPASIGFGRAEESRVVFNRRYRMTDGSVRTNPGVKNPEVVEPMGPIDPEIGVLCIQGMHEEPIGLLANYALHYVGAPDAQRSVSADYFGLFVKQIQRLYNGSFVAALSNGACGDINNVDVLGTGPGSVKNDQFKQSERVAALIAAGTLWACNGMDFFDNGIVGARMREVTLVSKGRPTDADLEQVKVIEAKEKPTMAERAFVRRITKRMQDVPESISTFVQALRIGDLGIAAVPGELMVELGLDIKAQSPFGQTTMVIELANDSVGYIPTQKSYDEGGYEPEASVFAPGCGEQIRDVAVALLTELYAR